MADEFVEGTLPHQASNRQSNAHHLRQKRARSQLSCIPCRNGKLKCNRVHEPACDQCMKRNRENACSWAPPPAKQKNTQNVKGRIRHLESLVVDLMNQQSGTGGSTLHEGKEEVEYRPVGEPTPPSSDENDSVHRRDDVDCVKPFGQMRISKNEISYVGETHWKAILSNIDSLRRELEDEEESTHAEDDSSPGTTPWRHDSNATSTGWFEQSQSTNGLDFILGNSSKITREQLIAAVPEKRIADRLLSLWFNSPDPFKPILHGPSFQEQYRLFWRDPSQTPTMWLGLLFAILSLAASFGLRECDASSPAGKRVSADVHRYRSLSASAAVLADFTKPKEHTIECLMLYGMGLRSSDAFVNMWLLVGLSVRLALRMGYHRDSANYPAISAFYGEMRRRVWAMLSMMDVLISFQLALPSMVKTLVSDTQPPRNLLDRDFNIDTDVLPPSRGIDELTPSSYVRAKLRLVSVFAEAAELSHATISPTHDDMMELDRRLEEAKSQLPPLLQMFDISQLVTDPAEQLMCRFNLDLLYLKTKIVLHRRYMETPFSHLLPQEQKVGIGMSRRMAVDCALSVLRHHQTIHTASQAGGQLDSVKWFMGSISTHDFLLAAMIICLELSQQISSSSIVNVGQCPLRQGFMEALEKSQQIWESTGQSRRRSRLQAQYINSAPDCSVDETEKAAIVMRVMLNKVKQRFPEQRLAEPEKQQSGVASASHPNTSSTIPFGVMVSNHTWDSILSGDVEFPDMNTGFIPNSGGFSDANSNLNDVPDQLDYIGTMLDTSGAIDWTMFDTGNQNSQHDGQFSISADTLADMPGMTNAGDADAGWLSYQDMGGVPFGVQSNYAFNDMT